MILFSGGTHMRNRAAWIVFAALLIACAAMLGGCVAQDDGAVSYTHLTLPTTSRV